MANAVFKTHDHSFASAVHICDFYATFVAMAGGDKATTADDNAPASLDSIDQTAYIMGRSNLSPRTLIIHDHYLSGTAREALAPADQQHHAVPPVDVDDDQNHFSAAETVMLQTKYTGGGCNEHFSNHFWLKTSDLAAVGIPEGTTQGGAVTINGKAVNIAHLSPDSQGSGCGVCCSSCPLSIFQIRPFTIADLNLHPVRHQYSHPCILVSEQLSSDEVPPNVAS
eukprot:SAG31_NODE_239_length_19453_cov_5.539888_6_plen_225_part_00